MASRRRSLVDKLMAPELRLDALSRRASLAFVEPDNSMAQLVISGMGPGVELAIPILAIRWRRFAQHRRQLRSDVDHDHDADEWDAEERPGLCSDSSSRDALLSRHADHHHDGVASSSQAPQAAAHLAGARSSPLPRESMAPLLLLVVLDCSLTVSSNFYNSHLLKHVPGFHFPLMYACVTFCTAAVGAYTLARRGGIPVTWSEARLHLPSLVWLAVVKVLSAALSNLALSRIELSVYKILLLTGPCFVVLLTALLNRCASSGGVSCRKLCSLGALAAGAALTCATSRPLHARQVIGIACALSSTALGAVGMVLSALLLAEGALAPLALLVYLSPTQAAMLAMALPWTELMPFARWAALDVRGAAAHVFVGALLSFTVQVRVPLAFSASKASSVSGGGANGGGARRWLRARMLFALALACPLGTSRASPLNSRGDYSRTDHGGRRSLRSPSCSARVRSQHPCWVTSNRSWPSRWQLRCLELRCRPQLASDTASP